MKNYTLVACLCTVLFTACGSLSSFESPNSLRNVAGTLYLTNGRSFQGKLIVQMGNLFGSDVKLLAEGDKKAMQFPLAEVAGYKIRNDYYALKDRRGGIGSGRHPSFMKRLTPADSRMHLYEDWQKEAQSGKGSLRQTTRYNTHHYLELPQEHGNEVYPLSGSHFVPHFETKMSRYVLDCPSLVKKIADKQEGYHYAQVSFFESKRVEVLLRIIDEYNRCR